MKNEARAGELLQSLVSSFKSKLPEQSVTVSSDQSQKSPTLVPKQKVRYRRPELDLKREKAELKRQRRIKMVAPEAVEGILKGALAQFGLDKAVDRYRFVTEWPAVVGQDAAAASRPEYIKNHVLYVKVKSSQWSQILSFRQDEILDRLEPLLSEGESVSSVRYFVGEM